MRPRPVVVGRYLASSRQTGEVFKRDDYAVWHFRTAWIIDLDEPVSLINVISAELTTQTRRQSAGRTG